jgi:hypothetical protein
MPSSSSFALLLSAPAAAAPPPPLRIAVDAGGDGFGLSERAARLYLERKRIEVSPATLDAARYEPRRDDPLLIAIIEELGRKAASSDNSEIAIVTIPAVDVPERGWRIKPCRAEGIEEVVERHMRWTVAGISEDRNEGGSEECHPLFRVAPTTTTTTTTTFSTVVFGVELAPILDGLLRVQATDNAGFVRLGTTLPFIGAFTRPTGCSWYEADMLTRHYYACGISLYCAMQSDAALAALFAPKPRAGRPNTLTMHDVRQMLHERWMMAHDV